MSRYKNRLRSRLAAVAATIFFIFFSASYITAGENKGRGEVELGKIIVTAQKQKENVQNVSASITVLDEMDIEDRNIDTLWELVNFAPNLMIFDGGMSTVTSQPTMRGISAPAMSFTTSVGLYVDGVPTLNAFGFEEGLIDIERVEVLRGPQGTLYGKNTETGAINIITRKPDNTFKGRISAQGGIMLSGENDDKLKGALDLSLSGPIFENKLFFGIAGQYAKQDGFIKNMVTGKTEDDREKLYGRAKLRLTPVDDLDMTLLVSHLSLNEGAGNMNMGEKGAAMFMLPVPTYRQVSSNLDSSKEPSINIQSLNLTYTLTDMLTLTSITARKISKIEAAADLDYSPMTMMHFFQDSEFSKLSQELRLDSSGGKLQWIAGLYYDKDSNDIRTDVESMMPMMAGLTSNDIDGDSYAVFGQAGYNLTEQFKVIGGLRYEKQDMDYRNNMLGIERDDSWQEVSPKVALEYRFTPEIMTYVSAAKGYRSGGFNGVATNPQYYSYDAETLWSYEIGVKSILLNKRLMLNGAVFYMDISDMQVEEATSPFMSYTTNAAEATSQGIELDVTARVTDGLSFNAGFGYTNIEFDKFSDALGDYKGNKNPYAPEYTFNIGAQYRHTSGFYARADLVGYGEVFFDKSNTYSRDPYELVNAKLGYEAKDFDVYLYAKNLFDEEYDSKGYYNGFYDIYSDPGEVGLQLTYRF